MIFKTLKKEEKKFDNALEGTEDYEIFNLNDLDGGETYIGKPVLLNIRENEFEDINTNEMVKKYSANINLINHDNEEIIRGRLNLKSLDDNVTFYKKSLGYDIIDSIEEINGTAPGTENLYHMSFKELQDFINKLTSMSILIKHHTGKFEYNTFRVTTVEGNEDTNE